MSHPNLHLTSLTLGVRDEEQNEQDGPNLSHILTGSGTYLSVSMVSKFVIIISGVFSLFTFNGLYLDLFKHLALIFPGAFFLGLFCAKGGTKNWKVLPLFHGNTVSLLLSW